MQRKQILHCYSCTLLTKHLVNSSHLRNLLQKFLLVSGWSFPLCSKDKCEVSNIPTRKWGGCKISLTLQKPGLQTCQNCLDSVWQNWWITDFSSPRHLVDFLIKRWAIFSYSFCFVVLSVTGGLQLLENVLLIFDFHYVLQVKALNLLVMVLVVLLLECLLRFDTWQEYL